jgi:hypothetical protein
MLKSIEKKLRLVRLRCGINLLLEHAGRVLFAAGVLAAIAVLGERLLALAVISRPTLWGFFGVVALLIPVLWFVKRPNSMQLSLLVDERLELHERFSTVLALSDSEDPFVRAARIEAYETAERIDPRRHFPIQPSRCWFYVLATWLMVAVLVLLLPQKDLFGFLKNRRQEQQQAKQVETAVKDVNDAATIVKSVLNQLGDPNIAEELAGLNDLPKNASPEDIKRDAIRKLTDLSDKLKQMQSGSQFDSMEMMKQMLKQLSGSTDPVAQQLRMAMAQGNFAKASNLLRQLQQELAEGKLSEEQKKQLSEQLQKLAKQLKELAEKNEQLEKELEKQGLNKKLAKLDEKQLRQELQKQGLSAEQIEQLMQKAAACRMASKRCSGLGQAMGACGTGSGGLSGDELAEAMEKLDALETLQRQIKLSEAAMDCIGGACQGLGEGMCKGLGGRGLFSEGPNKGPGPGTGGPGQGYGLRGYEDDGSNASKTTRVTNKTGDGPVIASWYVKGTQIKGEAKRDFSRVVQAGRDSASEAITENEIPRKYEQAIKDYFGRLEQSGN